MRGGRTRVLIVAGLWHARMAGVFYTKYKKIKSK